MGSLPALFTALQEASGLGNALDFVIFQSILLCLIAGDRHLLLRTAPDDVVVTAKCAILTLTSLFGISCRQLKIKPRVPSDASNDLDGLLRSILIHNVSSDELDTKHRPRKSKKNHHHSRSKSRTRYSQTKTHSGDVFQPLAEESHINEPHEPSRLSQRHSASEYSYSAGSSAWPSRPPHVARISSHSGFGMPGAVVFSGLENASLPSQRSLDRALADRKITLTPDPDAVHPRLPSDLASDEDRSLLAGAWHFPSEFIAISVCAANDSQSPALLRSLLDKFSLSATVNLSPSSRQLLEPIARTPSARPIHSHNGTPSLISPASSSDHAGGHSPIIRPTPRRVSEVMAKSHPTFPLHLLDFLRTLASEVRISPRASLYLKDLFSAARHCTLLDGTLLTAKAIRDAEALARAMRVLSPDRNDMEFIRSPLHSHNNDTGSLSSRSGSETARQSSYFDHGHSKAASTATDPDDLLTESFYSLKRSSSLEVSGRMVALVFPRVVSHRLSVRKSIHDQIFSSAVFSATSEDSGELEAPPTIKDILVDIIKEV